MIKEILLLIIEQAIIYCLENRYRYAAQVAMVTEFFSLAP